MSNNRKDTNWINAKEFKPQNHSPLPWRVEKQIMWHKVIAANGKVVCSCRNILDAERIVLLSGSTDR
jgi:hypothetical protein